MYYHYPMNAHPFLMHLRPAIRHGLKEMPYTSAKHAMSQVALIAFLMGRGYDYPSALKIVESWEVGEMLPGEEWV